MKYQVMAENPFRFLRGSCHLFYEDLYHSDALPHHPLTWISGDLHLENFGTYKGDTWRSIQRTDIGKNGKLQLRLVAHMGQCAEKAASNR